MAELWYRVGHFHGLEGGEGGEADGDAGGGNDGCDSFSYFKGEPGASGDGTTPGILGVMYCVSQLSILVKKGSGKGGFFF